MAVWSKVCVRSVMPPIPTETNGSNISWIGTAPIRLNIQLFSVGSFASARLDILNVGAKSPMNSPPK